MLEALTRPLRANPKSPAPAFWMCGPHIETATPTVSSTTGACPMPKCAPGAAEPVGHTRFGGSGNPTFHGPRCGLRRVLLEAVFRDALLRAALYRLSWLFYLSLPSLFHGSYSAVGPYNAPQIALPVVSRASRTTACRRSFEKKSCRAFCLVQERELHAPPRNRPPPPSA